MSILANDKCHIRHCWLYEFHCNANATDAAKNIYNAYGDKAIARPRAILKQIITGDEKWVLYENPKRRF